MRTIEEIKTQMGGCTDDMDREDRAYCEGMDDAFKVAIKMIASGASSADIRTTAQKSQYEYRSHGNDAEDAWMSGYITGLQWAGESFDWNEAGEPVNRFESL